MAFKVRPSQHAGSSTQAKSTLSATAAAALDRELMSSCAFSIDQLMELAGLSVSQAGGDGLPAEYGKVNTAENASRRRLVKQLSDLNVQFVEDFSEALKVSDHVVDAIFGFSFSGEVREPFPAVIRALQETKLPVTSVDAPSSWDIENGPPNNGLGSTFHPDVLVSLTAPKPLVKHFAGRHFIGGRFVPPGIAQKYDLDLPEYGGIDQVVEVGANGQRL
ncbi:unnamed protein product [Parascedosporium putredinis]|uniref:NAD(P)H-hydrate epimerase n=1 Tax=Parascedosporium putredinis TaxID=1442378 RepID=A0A9P1GVP3_9PEZI|nr:unnamed protein product [Parascedosporium putredinis]CAI7988215.1 unnamed protein product [Parascedosporium putredinis]